jgi:hypothetical protein
MNCLGLYDLAFALLLVFLALMLVVAELDWILLDLMVVWREVVVDVAIR